MITDQSVVRPEALDYLAGLWLDPARLPEEGTWDPVHPRDRRLASVRGIGCTETGPDASRPPSSFPTEALLAGLAGERIPIAMQIVGSPSGVTFAVGTWGTPDAGDLAQQYDVVTSLLDGVYPSVDRLDDHSPVLPPYERGGIVCGVPAAETRDDETPWDRLLRGLQGGAFAVLILGEPVEPTSVAALRDIALDDMRAAVSAEDAGRQTPITRAYLAQLEALVASLDRGLAMGAWRTGVYLLGDQASYWRLAAGWRGIYSDAKRELWPMRVASSSSALRLAGGWTLPYEPAPAGQRAWRHPFLNQTLLDTRQLSAYMHFPRHETPGFSVRPAPRFGVSHPAPRDVSHAIEIGEVLAQQKLSGTSYAVELDELTRHAFVAGVTGSGKTNTLLHILTRADQANVPFLVIEPAKTEYRELVGRPGFGGRVRVFTLGREHVAPLRMNPFEVPEGIDVSTHVDLLMAVFMGSFPMWVPLPQVLEQCLIELYSERGWDFATGEPRGGRSPMALDLPTLGELAAAVERVVPALGYKTESTQEITASLITRLNSLRRGARGLMLDVERSVPMSELLSAPTIIELEGLGDDADKAFVMGLLLVRLYEHRRAEASARLTAAAAASQPAPPSARLAHIVVVEEAHRLLAKTDKPVDSWHADPQGAFADAFSQMLAEVRAYGQAMVIADQVPVRLAPEVIKNTNLKIVHRLVAAEDRTAMAGAMSMSDAQSQVLSTLPRGRAAVFSEGDHTPVVVQIPKAKELGESAAVDDARLARELDAWRCRPDISSYFDDHQVCSGVCRSASDCREARRLAESPAGRLLATRMFNTALTHSDGLDAVWPDVTTFVSSRTRDGDDLRSRVHEFAVHALHLIARRRATQGRWPPTQAEALMVAFRAVLAQRTADSAPWLGATSERQAMLDAAAPLVRRTHNPYPLCSAICDDATCRYRHSVADVILAPPHQGYSADLSAQAEPGAYVIQVAAKAARDVIATHPEDREGTAVIKAARWRALGCAAQVKFCAADHPGEAATIIASALWSLGWNVTSNDSVSESRAVHAGLAMPLEVEE